MHFRCLPRANPQSKSVVQNVNSRWRTFALLKPALLVHLTHMNHQPDKHKKIPLNHGQYNKWEFLRTNQRNQNPNLISCKRSSTVLGFGFRIEQKKKSCQSFQHYTMKTNKIMFVRGQLNAIKEEKCAVHSKTQVSMTRLSHLRWMIVEKDSKGI